MQMPSLIPEPGSLFDRIMTFVLANLLWCVFAVLIITLPAATAGLFAVLAPLARGRDAEIFATFFGTMRRQWFKSTVIFVADVVIGVVITINFRALNLMDPPGPMFWLFRSVYIFLVIATLMANLYLWPLLVLFDLHLRHLVSVSLRLAFAHALWSLFTLGLALLPLVLVVFAPLLLSVVAVFSTTVLIVNWGAWRIIEKYVTPEELAGLNQP
jgi:uncharacterized membrane protein YesL